MAKITITLCDSCNGIKMVKAVTGDIILMKDWEAHGVKFDLKDICICTDTMKTKPKTQPQAGTTNNNLIRR